MHYPLIIGTALTITGIIVAVFVFTDGVKGEELEYVNIEQSVEYNFDLNGKGIGFFQITISDYNRDVLYVQIIDPDENVITDKKISTKMSANYFNFELDGNYKIKISNLSDRNLEVKSEFGDTNSSKLLIPGIVTAVGIVLIFFDIFWRVKNHRIAQP